MDALDFTVSPTDRSLILGLGLFETILAVDGRPIHAERHLARFLANCERLGWEPGHTDLKEVMSALIQTNELTTGRVRIRLSISGGSGLIHDLALGADHVIWMSAVRAADAPPATTANLSPWLRNEHSALAGLKCASYAENLVALERAASLGFEETVFLNTAGNLCEAATSNLFLVKNGGVLTPSLESGCLAGITRAVVIELAGKLGIPCEERNLASDELHGADEVFLTSSIRGLMGLSKFGNRNFPPGPVTQVLREAWNAATLRKTDD